MSPENRMILLKSVPLDEAVSMYAQLTPDPAHGPRLSKSEWIALGEKGQKSLHPSLKSWEIKIAYDWLDSHEIETIVAKERAEAVSAIRGYYGCLLIGGNLAILASGAILGGFVGFFLACILSCFFDMIVTSSIKSTCGLK